MSLVRLNYRSEGRCTGEDMRINEVVEESLRADERFRHLTVLPEIFEFEMGGVKYWGEKGKTYIQKDQDGVVRMIYGVWMEESNK